MICDSFTPREDKETRRQEDRYSSLEDWRQATGEGETWGKRQK